MTAETRPMLQVVAEVILEVVCGMTGHAVLWAVTIGRWRPLNGRDDAATVAGILFWVAVGAGVWLVFFR